MKHSETKYVNHKPKDLFNLVSDIKKYPEFLPWCLGSRVKLINQNNLNADLIVGFKLYREVFKSNVILNRKKFEINVHYLDGPFDHLSNYWKFRKKNNGCEVDFFVEFNLNARILNAILERFFNEAIFKMVDAFEKRANFLYK